MYGEHVSFFFHFYVISKYLNQKNNAENIKTKLIFPAYLGHWHIASLPHK